MKAIIPTHDQVRRALQVYEEIEKLENELKHLFGVNSSERAAEMISRAGSLPETGKMRRGRPSKADSAGKHGRRKLNSSDEASITDPPSETAQRKGRGRPSGLGPKNPKPKRTISAAHREAIAAAQKRRWAAAKAE